jgi:hypothetical protein
LSEEQMETYYKVLNSDGISCHGGRGQWKLAIDGEPGEWMPVVDNILACYRGYHLCRRADLIYWLGPTIWIAEGRGTCIQCNDKVVFEQARLVAPVPSWNEKTARLFACDCAERVMPIYRKHHPNDLRLQQCIDIARKFAKGEATQDELDAARVAARAAARAAAWTAAWTEARTEASSAAWAAARAAARTAARTGAWAEARAAARAAAWTEASAKARAGAGAGAWGAERSWQTNRLFEYLGQ